MKIIPYDYETYYSDDFTLKHMTIPQYIFDPRFEVIGCAVMDGLHTPPIWLEEHEFRYFLKQQDPNNTALVSHNALFDSYITSMKYGFIPKLTSCTLSMARAMLGHMLARFSLASVAGYFNLGDKKSHHLAAAKGMRLTDLQRNLHIYSPYKQYACEDCLMSAQIFERLLADGFPVDELAVLDMVLGCALKPKFKVNIDVLYTHLAEVIAKKTQLLAACGADKDSLMSNDKLAAVLRDLGVEPPKKISLTTGKEAYAMAKTDVAFLDLLEHDNPMVQAVVAARLGVKSTLEESRTQKFILIGTVTPESKMPVPLGYGKAHTHRLGGDWEINLQNLTRGGNLRASLEAPPGFKVVKADASQIECRLTGWFSNCTALTQKFIDGTDVYAWFASMVWLREVDKKSDERFCGKTAVLGLGFGMAWRKFQLQIKIQSENILKRRISLQDAEAGKIVTTYRTLFKEIPDTWWWLANMLPLLAYGGAPVQRGPLIFEKGRIILPSISGAIGEGLSLKYHNLRQEDGEWVYTYGKQTKRLFGGKQMENIAQALDRILVLGAAVRLQKRLAGIGGLALQSHDENVYIVPDRAVETVATILLQEMERRPPWGLDIPLKAEVQIGQNYRDLH